MTPEEIAFLIAAYLLSFCAVFFFILKTSLKCPRCSSNKVMYNDKENIFYCISCKNHFIKN